MPFWGSLMLYGMEGGAKMGLGDPTGSWGGGGG